MMGERLLGANMEDMSGRRWQQVFLGGWLSCVWWMVEGEKRAVDISSLL